MATNSLIRFTIANETKLAHIYKHYDGYPDQVLEQLDSLHSSIPQRRYTPHQIASWFIQSVYADSSQLAAFTSTNAERTLAGEPPTPESDVRVVDSESSVPTEVEYLYRVRMTSDGGTCDWSIQVAKVTPPHHDISIEELYESAVWQVTKPLQTLISDKSLLAALSA